MAMAKRLKISSGGQIAVPAAVRKRWGTSTVLAEDHGDKLVLTPAPDDPIAAAAGALAAELASGPSLDEVRQLEREEEAEREDRRWPRR